GRLYRSDHPAVIRTIVSGRDRRARPLASRCGKRRVVIGGTAAVDHRQQDHDEEGRDQRHLNQRLAAPSAPHCWCCTSIVVDATTCTVPAPTMSASGVTGWKL